MKTILSSFMLSLTFSAVGLAAPSTATSPLEQPETGNQEFLCKTHYVCPDGHVIGCKVGQSFSHPDWTPKCTVNSNSQSVRCYQLDSSGAIVEDFSDSCS